MRVHVTVIRNSRHVTNYNLSSGTRTVNHLKVTTLKCQWLYTQHCLTAELVLRLCMPQIFETSLS
jgi:hypothetical protein